jgi:fructoselysine and glucoselysine-specific PTS system IIA component
MIRFVLASHGTFANGIYNALKIIMGEQQNISTLCAYVDEKADLKKQVSSIIDELSIEDELIVITDIFGGSVNNEFMNYTSRENIHLIAGLNLPLLIELVSRQQEENIPSLINEVLKCSRDSIQYCNSTLKLSSKIRDEEF